MAKNILKIENTDIKNLKIESTNGYKLLSCSNSNIKDSLFYMSFNANGLGYGNIDDDLIDINNTSLNVGNMDISEILSMSNYVINSNNNSKSFFGNINGTGDASPDWLSSGVNEITYGNNISYNIY